jgi:predicted anti-sigma-YlaC factor YlaD
MKCDRAMKMFLELDNNEAVPLRVKAHMVFCPRCRAEITAMAEELLVLRHLSPYEPDADITAEVMAAILKLSPVPEHTISNIKWLSVGSIILMSLFLISFSESLQWLTTRFGAHLMIPLSVVMGLIMSLYAILFISTHLEELKVNVDNTLKRMGWR